MLVDLILFKKYIKKGGKKEMNYNLYTLIQFVFK